MNTTLSQSHRASIARTRRMPFFARHSSHRKFTSSGCTSNERRLRERIADCIFVRVTFCRISRSRCHGSSLR